MWDYDFSDYNETGRFRKYDVITGEVLAEGSFRPVFDGDVIISAEQIAARENYRKEQEKKARRRAIGKENGNHFFVPRTLFFSDLKPQTATRLIYLLTYADYSERGGRLKRSQKTEMQKKDLPDVLKLSKDATDDFLAEVSPKYIMVSEEGYISATETAFHRGKLGCGKSYHRFYDKWVQGLYKNTAPSKHKHLGYIFQLLPYISIEYNVLCFNPTEEETEKIQYMNLGEFCEKIHFDKSHAERLLKIYRQLRFPVMDETGSHMERFVSISCDGLNRHNAKVFVNPRILYSGTHPEKVELLAGFSKD